MGSSVYVIWVSKSGQARYTFMHFPLDGIKCNENVELLEGQILRRVGWMDDYILQDGKTYLGLQI